jgi:hypothetical protein
MDMAHTEQDLAVRWSVVRSCNCPLPRKMFSWYIHVNTWLPHPKWGSLQISKRLGKFSWLRNVKDSVQNANLECWLEEKVPAQNAWIFYIPQTHIQKEHSSKTCGLALTPNFLNSEGKTCNSLHPRNLNIDQKHPKTMLFVVLFHHQLRDMNET